MRKPCPTPPPTSAIVLGTDCPAFSSPRYTHLPRAASGGFCCLHGLSPSLVCLLLSWVWWCLLRLPRFPVLPLPVVHSAGSTWVAELPLLSPLLGDCQGPGTLLGVTVVSVCTGVQGSCPCKCHNTGSIWQGEGNEIQIPGSRHQPYRL